MEEDIFSILSLLLNIQGYFIFFPTSVLCVHYCNLVNHPTVLSQSRGSSTLFYSLILLVKKREETCLGAWQTVRVKPGNYRKTLKMSETESKHEIFYNVGKKPWSGIGSSDPDWTLPGVSSPVALKFLPGPGPAPPSWTEEQPSPSQFPEPRSSMGTQLPRICVGLHVSSAHGFSFSWAWAMASIHAQLEHPHLHRRVSAWEASTHILGWGYVKATLLGIAYKCACVWLIFWD